MLTVVIYIGIGVPGGVIALRERTPFALLYLPVSIAQSKCKIYVFHSREDNFTYTGI